MFASTSCAIETLPLSQRERDHRSRTRLGFHVFVSRFFADFKTLQDEEKWERVSTLMGVRRHREDIIEIHSDESVDSSDSDESTIPVYQVMRLACIEWRSMPPHHIESWSVRAEMLNRRPLPGRFVLIPGVLGEGQIMERHVKEALSGEWERIVKILRNAVTREPRRDISQRVVLFGKERVRILSQTYRRVYLGSLMKKVVFGDGDYSIATEDERVYQTKKVEILHFSSLARMKQVFTLAGLCGVEFLNATSGNVHSCCGKVSTILRGKTLTGYIIDENECGGWIVRLGNNRTVEIPRVKYNREVGEYVYDNRRSNRRRVISFYWPIRILIHNNGDCKMTINRLAIDSENRIMCEHSS